MAKRKTLFSKHKSTDKEPEVSRSKTSRKSEQDLGVENAYDRISESWDEYRQKPFSAMPIFLEEFQKRFSKRKGTFHAKILDAGCGNARNSIWLCGKLPNASIYCADISAGMLVRASKNIATACKAHSCIVLKADIGNTGFSSSSFDAVLCTAVLHHISNKAGWVRALSEIRRVLKPTGFAFITVWNDPDAKPGTDKNVVFPLKEGGKIERGYHFFSMRELEDAARNSGLEISEMFLEFHGQRQSKSTAAKAQNICMIMQKQRPRKKPSLCKSGDHHG